MQFTSSDLMIMNIYSSLMATGIFNSGYRGNRKLTEEDYEILLREQLLELKRGTQGTVRDLEEVKRNVSAETLALYAEENKDRAFSAQKKANTFVSVRRAVEGEKITVYNKSNTGEEHEAEEIGIAGRYILTRCDAKGNPILNENGKPNEWQIEADKFENTYSLRDDGLASPKQEERIMLRADRDFTIYRENRVQNVKAGDYLNITNPDRIYAVSKKEFEDTYEPLPRVLTEENKENIKLEETRIAEYVRERKEYMENSDNVLYADYTSVLTEGAVLVNAHSTQEFIEQAEKNQGKVLEGHLVNVDFKEVEEHFKKNGLEMPEIGAVRLEHCDFRGCSDLQVPYNKAYLELGCKTNETEQIKEQLMGIKGVEGMDVSVGYRPPEGVMRMKGEFHLTVTDIVDGKETHLASFKLNEMPKDGNYKTAFMEHLRNNLVKEETELLNYEVVDTLTENRKRSMIHRADVFYENTNVKKDFTFKDKDEAIQFAEFMSKRAEALAKDDFNGMGKHWNYEAIQFTQLAEIMKKPEYDLNRCETLINHPSGMQGMIKVQRDAWVVKNESDMKKSINQVRKAEKALIDEQKQKDERFFGLGKYWERTVNRKEYESRNFKIQSMRKDRTAMEKNLKSFTENNYARANTQFDTKLMGCFREMKDTLRFEKPKAREIKTVERVQAKVQEKTIGREKG